MGRQFTYVIGIVVVALAGIIYTLAAGNEPLLGLDLQGGASIVLEPEPNADGSEVSDDVLDQAVEIIRNRVDGLGVREPEITRQGSTILVQIPGVDDQQRALDLVGQTAELRFRPVLAEGPPGTDFAGLAEIACTSEEGAESSAPLPTVEPTPDAEAAECMIGVLERESAGQTILSHLLLGPAPLLLDQTVPGERFSGQGVESATARINLSGPGLWGVSMTLRPDSPGIDDFNALAAQCVSQQPTCPTGQMAIEIDGVVASAPNVNAANFDRSGVSITGQFSDSEAKDLALVLRFGSLPVELVAQESRIVSSTLGEDALDAGIAAGIIGLLLVSAYLIAYYRILGLIAISSLAISGALLWTMIAWLGESQGLALTLAGVTGLIVSVGISVDSNVVYFEHLKEDVRGGRTVRSAVERAFPIAYSTIVKADMASLIAAGVLYFLTVGQVKGFALFLGLATVLDLVATYFFMGPAIRVMARRDSMTDHPNRYGIPVATSGQAAS